MKHTESIIKSHVREGYILMLVINGDDEELIGFKVKNDLLHKCVTIKNERM